MKFYLGVTDNNWYDFLSIQQPEDLNFWQPNPRGFRLLNEGAPFLFKLKSPRNVIGGVGFFTNHTILPLSVAWEIFEQRNGATSQLDLLRSISPHRKDWFNSNPTIGCIVLTDPIFFRPEDWIRIPWDKNIVQGKSYDLSHPEDRLIWNLILPVVEKYLAEKEIVAVKDSLENSVNSLPLFGFSYQKIRLGQGPFRVKVTDAYTRRCSISGEKTLPVLEAAHIKAYGSSGPHSINNGLLLRSDLHKLFDSGYVTITTDYKVEVSRRIKEEYENGKEYYRYHGQSLVVMPNDLSYHPSQEYIFVA